MKEHLSLTRNGFDTFKNQLENIVNNTALPDIIKMQKREALMGAIRNKIFSNVSDRLFAKDSLIGRVKENISKKILSAKDTALSTLGTIGMAADQKAMMDEMPSIPGSNKSTMAGGLAAGKLNELLGIRLRDTIESSKLLKKNIIGIKDFATNPEEYFEKKMMEHTGSGYGDRALRGIFGGLKSMTAYDRDYGERIHMDKMDMDEVSTFNNKTQAAITMVIPELLSKIYSEAKAIRTGSSTPEDYELSYDFHRQTFVSNEDIKDVLKGRLQQDISKDTIYNIDRFLSKIAEYGPLEVTPETEPLLRKGLMSYFMNGGTLALGKMLTNDFKDNFDIRLQEPLMQSLEGALEKAKEDPYLYGNLTDYIKTARDSVPSAQQRVNELRDIGKSKIIEEMGLAKWDEFRQEYIFDRKAYKDLLVDLAGKSESSFEETKPTEIATESETIIEGEPETAKRLRDTVKAIPSVSDTEQQYTVTVDNDKIIYAINNLPNSIKEEFDKMNLLEELKNIGTKLETIMNTTNPIGNIEAEIKSFHESVKRCCDVKLSSDVKKEKEEIKPKQNILKETQHKADTVITDITNKINEMKPDTETKDKTISKITDTVNKLKERTEDIASDLKETTKDKIKTVNDIAKQRKLDLDKRLKDVNKEDDKEKATTTQEGVIKQLTNIIGKMVSGAGGMVGKGAGLLKSLPFGIGDKIKSGIGNLKERAGVDKVRNLNDFLKITHQLDRDMFFGGIKRITGIHSIGKRLFPKNKEEIKEEVPSTTDTVKEEISKKRTKLSPKAKLVKTGLGKTTAEMTKAAKGFSTNILGRLGVKKDLVDSIGEAVAKAMPKKEVKTEPKKKVNVFDRDQSGRRDGDWRDRLNIFKKKDDKKKPGLLKSGLGLLKSKDSNLVSMLMPLVAPLMGILTKIGKGIFSLPKLLMNIGSGIFKLPRMLLGGMGGMFGKLGGIIGKVTGIGSKIAGLFGGGVGGKVAATAGTKVAAKVGSKVGLKVAGKLAGKLASRAIPGLGWGLAAWDAINIGKKMLIDGKSFKSSVSEQMLGTDITDDAKKTEDVKEEKPIEKETKETTEVPETVKPDEVMTNRPESVKPVREMKDPNIVAIVDTTKAIKENMDKSNNGIMSLVRLQAESVKTERAIYDILKEIRDDMRAANGMSKETTKVNKETSGTKILEQHRTAMPEPAISLGRHNQ